MRRMAFAVLALAAALFTVLFTANVAGAQAPAATVSVTGTETTWSPPNVTVTTGETVRWSFTGSTLPHNVHGTNDQADWNPPLQSTIGTARLRSTTRSRRRVSTRSSATSTARACPAPSRSRARARTRWRTCSSSRRRPASGTTRSTRASRRSRRSARPTTSRHATEDSPQFNAANLAQFDAVVFLSTTGDVLTDDAAGRVRALHPGRRRLRRHPRGGRHRVHLGLVRPDGRRLLQEPSARDIPNRDRRHRGHRRALHREPPGPLDADRRVVQLPIARQPVSAAAAPTTAPATATSTSSLRSTSRPTTSMTATTGGDDHPISWCSDFDGGHVWYTGMGHTAGVVRHRAGNIR